jgi:hypothetical protein
MWIVALLSSVLVVVAARLALIRSMYFQELGKDLPPMPVGLRSTADLSGFAWPVLEARIDA